MDGVFLRALKESTRNAILNKGIVMRFKKGDFVFRKKEKGTNFYLIKSGAVRIEGSKKTYSILHEGDCFGEMSLLDGLPRSADAIALTDVEVIKLPRAVFLKELKRNSKFQLELLKVLSTRIRLLDTEIDSLLGEKLLRRVAKHIFYLAGKSRHRLPSVVSVTELARLVGARRESVSRCLKILRNAGAIDTHEGISITSPYILKTFSG